jgi:hypothetical protein
VFIGAVKYVDFARERFSLDNGFWPIVHKRAEFVHDQEVRAVVWERESQPGGLVLPPFGARGEHVAVDVAALIQEVVVSPLASSSFVQTVKQVVSRFELLCDVRRSKLLDPPNYRVPSE